MPTVPHSPRTRILHFLMIAAMLLGLALIPHAPVANAATVQKLYWPGNGNMQRGDLDGTNQTTLISGLSCSRGVALDSAASLIYWTDECNRTIGRANSDGSGVTTLISGRPNSPESIVADHATGKLYWTEASTIQRANLDGSGITQIFSSAGCIYGLDLNASAGQLYFTDACNGNGIKRVNTDGSGLTTISSSYAYGLTLDVAGGKLYWANCGQVIRANLDGSNVQTIASGVCYTAVAVNASAGKIYLESCGGSIDSANLDGSGAIMLFPNNGGGCPWQIALAQQYLSADMIYSLAVDADNNGFPSPGDTLQYQVAVANPNQTDLTNVTFSDTPGANTTLVAGSVTTTQGSVTSGNTGGNTSVGVDLGTIAASGSATIMFNATIKKPLGVGVATVKNQGSVSSTETGAVSTNDPGTATAGDMTVTPVTAGPLLTADMADALAVDADSDGVPSPGDTIEYQATILNSGNGDAANVVFTDTPSANTALVVGSVTTTQGTVTTGNTGGNTTVGVNLGTVAGDGGSATITFRVMIKNLLPAGVTSVSTQGSVSATGVTTFNTNDPDTSTAGDTTATAVTAAPALDGAKAVTLATDADNNGFPSPGDTLQYQVTIKNTGNIGATGVAFSDTPDTNTTLVAGSVTASQGTVATGNTNGDTDVAVNVGALSGAGGSATVTFNVLVKNPLPAGVSSVSNQGTITSGQTAASSTDDPNTQAAGDATTTNVTAAPSLSADKAMTLATDADANGFPSPGDTLQYQVTIQNTGNTGATGLVFAETPQANTTLVVGSVTASQGTVTTGNTAGDNDISVNVGTVAGGNATATVTFQVRIKSPLPAGVTSVSNQGTVTSAELPALLTNDPDTQTADDATTTAVTTAPALAADQAVTLATDADNNGFPSPGDTLLYQVTVTNNGNTGATGVAFAETLEANTTLVVGSVQVSQGTVTTGNTAGDNDISVNVGTVAGGGDTASASFRVTIKKPIPLGITNVSNQGSVTSAQLPALLTNDPDTQTADDATTTTVTAAPALAADMAMTLAIDADNNGFPSPGDTLQYQVTIQNTGNTGATLIAFNETLDVDMALVVGSVQASQGTVTTGNTAGDTDISVNVGTIDGGDTASVSFRAVIASPLPAGVTSVSNQGTVQSAELPEISTNDPNTLAANDPLVTVLVAAPVLAADKSATLATDADNNGFPSPGDTLLYQVSVANNGNIAATNVVFSDTLDTNTTLLLGSVQTSQGSIAGQSAGTVGIDLATVAGGSSATISFRAVIKNPLPGGVLHVSNQGTVSSAELPNVLTNNPDTVAAGDATHTAVTAAPVLTADKAATLVVDTDNNKLASPGDTLLYQITIANNGNIGATNVVFSDTPDSNTSIVVGSVQTSAGTVTGGNPAGSTSIGVNVGAIPSGGSVTISFRVTVNPHLPKEGSNVSNQAAVTSAELPQLLTNDPSTSAAGDPTATTLDTLRFKLYVSGLVLSAP